MKKSLSLILIFLVVLSLSVGCKKDSAISTDPVQLTENTNTTVPSSTEATSTPGATLPSSGTPNSGGVDYNNAATNANGSADTVVQNAPDVNGFQSSDPNTQNDNLTISSGTSSDTTTTDIVRNFNDFSYTLNNNHGVLKIVGKATYYAVGDQVVVRINGLETTINVNADGTFEVTVPVSNGDNYVTLLHRRDKNGDGTIAEDEIIARSPTFKVTASITAAQNENPYYQFQLSWWGGSPNAAEGYGDVDIWVKVDGIWVYYGNMNPSQGALDVDNRLRYGPENVRVKVKKATEVYVQYYTNVPGEISNGVFVTQPANTNYGNLNYRIKVLDRNGVVVKTLTGLLTTSDCGSWKPKKLVFTMNPSTNDPLASEILPATGITVE